VADQADTVTAPTFLDAALAGLAVTSADPRELSSTLVHSIGGLLILLTTAVLSVFKPRGLTSYGWRKQQERHAGSTHRSPAGPS
jgi:hypothetical protein